MSVNWRYARSLSRRLHQAYDPISAPETLTIERLVGHESPRNQSRQLGGPFQTRALNVAERRLWPVLAAVAAIVALVVIFSVSDALKSTPTPRTTDEAGIASGTSNSLPEAPTAQDTAGKPRATRTSTSPITFAQSCNSSVGPTAKLALSAYSDVGSESLKKAITRLYISSATTGTEYLCFSSEGNGNHLTGFARPRTGVIGYFSTTGANVYGAVSSGVARIVITLHVKSTPSGGWAVPSESAELDISKDSSGMDMVANGLRVFGTSFAELPAYDFATAVAYGADGQQIESVTAAIAK